MCSVVTSIIGLFSNWTMILEGMIWKKTKHLKFNSSPLQSYHPKRQIVFQPSIFQGYVKLLGCTPPGKTATVRKLLNLIGTNLWLSLLCPWGFKFTNGSNQQKNKVLKLQCRSAWWFQPTHLENMRKSNWVHLPQFSGWTRKNIWVATTYSSTVPSPPRTWQKVLISGIPISSHLSTELLQRDLAPETVNSKIHSLKTNSSHLKIDEVGRCVFLFGFRSFPTRCYVSF